MATQTNAVDRDADAKNVNTLMDQQKDISPRFAGEGLDYQRDGVDRSPETMANVEKLLKDGYVF